ncbi:UNVERIFIED_CONTAM: hypothetical protein NY603_41510, partial [Bacteroidetes bacterium 56_B9]
FVVKFTDCAVLFNHGIKNPGVKLINLDLEKKTPALVRRGRYKKEKTRFCITQNAAKRASNIYQQYFSMIFCIASQL